jgi:hypothetical protein
MHPFLDFPFSSFAHFLLSLSAIGEKGLKKLTSDCNAQKQRPSRRERKEKEPKKRKHIEIPDIPPGRLVPVHTIHL